MTSWYRQRVRERAYAIWEEEGREHGNDLAHWFRAKAEIAPEIRVTFDSNEWEDVVCPERCLPKQPERYPDLVKVHNAVKAGCVRGFICEVVATLEGVRRKERAQFFAKQTVEPRVLEAVQPDGTTSPIITMSPNQSHRPKLSLILIDSLRGAASMGMRVMTTLRYNELVFSNESYADEPQNIVETTGQVRAAIERRGVGRSKLEQFGHTLAMRLPGGSVYFDIPDAPMNESEEKKLAEYVAEWADGDAVTCHIAYQHDFFCTEAKHLSV